MPPPPLVCTRTKASFGTLLTYAVPKSHEQVQIIIDNRPGYVRYPYCYKLDIVIIQLYCARRFLQYSGLMPNKKISAFRVTRPYLNLLVKPRVFSGKKYIILCILKGEMPFKMHKIIFFSRKKKSLKKKMCLPYLYYQPCYSKHLFFYLV